MLFKLKRCYHLPISLLLLVSFIGCATIITGSSQKIQIKSSPGDAHVRIYDNSSVVIWDSNTPTTAVLKKGDGYFKKARYTVVVEKKGYKRQEFIISGSLRGGWYIVGNLIIGGLLGWLIVDPLTGGMWALSPKEINANLAEEAAFLNQNEGLMIVLKEDISPSLFNELNPIPIH